MCRSISHSVGDDLTSIIDALKSDLQVMGVPEDPGFIIAIIDQENPLSLDASDARSAQMIAALDYGTATF